MSYVVPVLDHVPSYDEFYRDYLAPNLPVMLPAAMVASWPAIQRYGHDGRIDWEALCADFGDHQVPVIVGSAERRSMALRDAIHLLRTSSEPVYIKDWHLVRSSRTDAHARDQSRPFPYVTPCLFADDWMNNVTPHARPTATYAFASDAWLTQSTEAYEADDFRFCYLGSRGSYTPLHRDVYTSYSWSTNIAGRKRWRLFAPDDARWLRQFPERRTSALASRYVEMEQAFHAGKLGAYQDGYEGWPGWGQVRERVYEIEQEPGQTIFVPSNWYHEVENLTDCMSINHNWCNAMNLTSMYDAMEAEVEDVAQALDDVRAMLAGQPAWQREFTHLVQQVVEQDAGWAWHGFWAMVVDALRRPPCDPTYAPAPAYVQSTIEALLERFRKRPDAPWLASGVHDLASEASATLSLMTKPPR